MSANAPANPNAVTVARPGAISVTDGSTEYNLDQFPTDQFNRLVPTQTIRMPTDLVVPVVNVVQLEPADSTGKSRDHYKSTDVPAGHRAFTARGLNKVADAAGVSFYGEHRIDDGSDPDVIGVGVTAEVELPTGQRRRTEGSQTINLRTWFSNQTSEPEKAKFRKQFYAHVATRARNRALRALLSMASSYTEREIARPFAVVTYAPNLSHPEMRASYIAAKTGAVAAAYGPGSAPRITTPEPALLIAPPLPDVDGPTADDQTHEGQFVEVDQDGPPLEFGADTVPAPPAPTASLVQRLQAGLEQNAAIEGAVTQAQKDVLGPLLAPIGTSWPPGVHAAFGIGPRDLLARHMASILEVARSMGDDAFRDAWVAMAGAQ